MRVSRTAYSSCSAKIVKEKEREGGREAKGGEKKEKNKDKKYHGKSGENDRDYCHSRVSRVKGTGVMVPS